ncbi:hypothetical protein CVT26_013856 [Gymnopilus dilepis]|uniref:Uncharacterized protein n=1 Tax=Gymnopilus dilepis TaxID=231916 RepID=A0A409VVW2_9AGAR|nr:hypothetical protein CVT26_013856 [Gymnopilus dilepis]
MSQAPPTASDDPAITSSRQNSFVQLNQQPAHQPGSTDNDRIYRDTVFEGDTFHGSIIDNIVGGRRITNFNNCYIISSPGSEQCQVLERQTELEDIITQLKEQLAEKRKDEERKTKLEEELRQLKAEFERAFASKELEREKKLQEELKESKADSEET